MPEQTENEKKPPANVVKLISDRECKQALPSRQSWWIFGQILVNLRSNLKF